MGKESFIIYSSFYKPISILSDKQLGRLFRAIFSYQLGEVVNVEDDIRMAFEFFKNQFEIDESKYQAKIVEDVENGRKGGNPNFKKGKANPYYKKGKKEITQDNPRLSNITQDNPRLSNITQDNPRLSEITQDNPRLSEITQDNPRLSEITQDKAINDNDNDNENVNEKDNVACATTRARSEVLSIDEIEKEIINAESKAETLQMLYRISKEDYESIRDEILAEWKFQSYANTLSDAMHHFVNLVRVKAKSLKRPPNVPAKELSGRQRDFWQQVQSFAERYDGEILKAFYAKWAEADASGRYMKWEFENGFDIGKRLAKFHAYWSKT